MQASKLINILSITVLALLAAACGGNDMARLNGTVEGKPTQNMRLVYFNGEAVQNGVTGIREGEFGVKFGCTVPVMVELYDNDYHLFGRFFAKPGDKIEATLSPKNPYLSKFSGNEVNQRYTDFCNRNANALLNGGVEANRLISDYIAKNKNDIAATMLLITAYDGAMNPDGARRLFDMLTPEAKPASLVAWYEYMLADGRAADKPLTVKPMKLYDRLDSVQTYNPSQSRRTLIVVSDATSGRLDSIVPELRRLRRANTDSQLTIIDLGTDRDVSDWRMHTVNDSVKGRWIQAWNPGRLSAPAVRAFRASRLPHFVVCDSAGRQLYAGPSLEGVRKALGF